MTTSAVPTPQAEAPSAESARRKWILGAAAAGAVVLAVLIWAAVGWFSDNTPRLNENAVVLAKFVASSRFEALPFEQQRQFYKVLDDRDQELDQAYRDTRVKEPEYRAGLEAAWLGKHLNRVEKYFALPLGQGRIDYVNKLLDKRERKNAKPHDPAALPDIDADETAAELKVEKWPSAPRTQWDQFHAAYRKQRKAREAAQEPQTRPAR
jgi:hypothetical protein